MTIAISIDIETASELDLTEVGAYRYFEHVSTKLYCLAWRRHDIDARGIWRPGWYAAPALIEGLREGEVHAWNAQFERLAFISLAFSQLPQPTFNQWRCTAARARQNALPGKLGDAAKLLRVPTQKQDTRVMKKLSDASYTPTSEELVALMEYCMADVDAEYEIGELLPPMTPDELYAYRHNERINDRGVQVDTAFARRMLDYCEQAVEEINCELTKLTDGKVTAYTQVERIKEYLGWHGAMDASAIEQILRTSIPDRSRRILELRQMGAKSSAAKYQQMVNRVSSDGRLRGMFVYSGAGQTGRYSSTGVQLHNLVRDVYPDAERRIADAKQFPLVAYKLLYGEPVMHQAAKLLRPTLQAAEGKVFIIADYSAVEAKGLPWLAEEAGEVAAWASGKDRYIEDAANVFHKAESEITKDERQAGKIVRLACGFSGKGGALMAMAAGYGLPLTKSDADTMARAWHAANPWVEAFARRLHAAAIRAVSDPGVVYDAGAHIKYACEIRGGVRILRCQLPSGRIISYHNAISTWNGGHGEFELSAIKPRGGFRERLWHGLLAENVTQAACNDLLRYAIGKLQNESAIPVVAHVHDEVVCEVPAIDQDECLATVRQVMETPPPWATDFPLTATVAVAPRYTK